MKYSLIQVSNGNYSIVSEHSDLNASKVAFHNTAAALWNAPDVNTACIMITDENLDVVGGTGGYKEFISHVEPTPEPEPKPSEGE